MSKAETSASALLPGPISRRRFTQLSAALAASSIDAWARGESPNIPEVFFPYGAHFYREPSLPLERLDADMPLLKRLGLNMLNIQQSWAWNEIHEGQIELAKLEHIVSSARDNGLAIYLTVTLEQAPAWLWKKFPDARMVYEDGQPLNDPTQYLLPQDGKPGPCWCHPGARDAAKAFLRQLARRMARFDNIVVWNVWQEIGLDPESSPERLGLCYCPNTLAAFRAWLRTRYASLDKLNQRWSTAFGEWDEVEPPRRFAPVPSLIDWRFYMEDVYLREVLEWKSAAIREGAGRPVRIMTHTAGPHIGGASDWSYASAVDLYGSSCYPGWGEVDDPKGAGADRPERSAAVLNQMLDVALRCDYARSAAVNEEFWAAELQGGRAPGGFAPGRVPDAGDIRRWVLLALAGGARGISFWNHRSEIFWNEAYGFGLLELGSGRSGEADRTDRADEAGRIGRAIAANAAELFSKGERPASSVAILVDEDLHHFIGGTGQHSRELEERNIRGLYRMLWLGGFTVDFLSAAQLEARAARYGAILLPLPLSLPEDRFASLRGYVEGGGAVISDCCPGRFTAYGMAYPGEMAPAAVALFGAAHKRLVSLADNLQDRMDVSAAAASVDLRLDGTGSMAGQCLKAAGFLQIVEPVTAEVILRSGQDAAGTAHSLGKGKAVLLGTLAGAGAGVDAGACNQAFLAALLQQLGVKPQSAGGLLTVQRRFGRRAATFFVNPRGGSVTAAIAVAPGTAPRSLLGEPSRLQGERFEITVGPMDVACVLS